METLVYKTVNGCEILLDVYPVHSVKPAPVVVYIHGGALIMGHRGQIQPVFRHLFQRAGHAVVAIDYRLAPETKLSAIMEDVVDAFAWLRRDGATRFRLDPERVAVAGNSAGGYLALMTGTWVMPQPRALVSFYGYGDIIAPWYSEPDAHYNKMPKISPEEAYASVGTEPISQPPPAAAGQARSNFYLYCRQQGLWPTEVMGIDPKKDPQAFDRYRPERNVSRNYPPTILFHGTADTDVPYSQSAAMAQALASAGVPHEFVTIPGGPHGFDSGVRFEDLEAPDHSVAVRCLVRAVSFISLYI